MLKLFRQTLVGGLSRSQFRTSPSSITRQLQCFQSGQAVTCNVLSDLSTVRLRRLNEFGRRNLSTSTNLFSSTKSTASGDAFDQLHDATSKEIDLNDKELIDLSSLADFADKSIVDDLIQTGSQTIENVNNLNLVLSASDIGLTPFLAPRLFYDLITALHNYTQFSWVASIGLTCLMLRILTFPLYIKSKKSSIELSEKTFKMQKSFLDFNPTSGGPEFKAQRDRAMKSMSEFNSYLPKTIISPLAQGIVFSSFFFCLRAMAKYPIPTLKDEQFLWVTSLAETDPYCLFPLLTSTTMFLMLKYNMEVDMPQANKKIMNFFIYSLPIVTFAFTSQMPANLTIYWFINNYITVFVFFMLKIPKIKNLFGFPELSKETQQLEIKFNVNEDFQSRMKQIRDLYESKERDELEQKKDEEARQTLIKKIQEMKKTLEEMEKRK